jgi:hypothetical protein
VRTRRPRIVLRLLRVGDWLERGNLLQKDAIELLAFFFPGFLSLIETLHGVHRVVVHDEVRLTDVRRVYLVYRKRFVFL